jgi:hypothetical protein
MGALSNRGDVVFVGESGWEGGDLWRGIKRIVESGEWKVDGEEQREREKAANFWGHQTEFLTSHCREK